MKIKKQLMGVSIAQAMEKRGSRMGQNIGKNVGGIKRLAVISRMGKLTRARSK